MKNSKVKIYINVELAREIWEKYSGCQTDYGYKIATIK